MLGNDEDLDWFEKEISAKFEVKIRGRLGPGVKDTKAIRILNRIAERTKEGIWYEADQRHAELLVQHLGLDNNRIRCDVPGEKLPYEEDDDEPLTADDVKRYQASVARANYLAQDRPDIQWAVKEVSV